MDFKLALKEAERELLTHGVTTMYHSLSLYKLNGNNNKPIRKKENVKKLIDLISKTQLQDYLIRHKFHARFEIDNVESICELKTYINEGKVDMLSFMDHTPGQGQYRSIEGFKKMTRLYGNTMSEGEIDTLIEIREKQPKLVDSDYKEITKLAKAKNVAIASHDDDSVEKLKIMQEYGVTISEFPITMEVAKKAHETGFHTVAGAPNVLLGGSHSGNLNAHEAIEAGVIDTLCSDYYPAAILHSIFKLHRKYGHDLSEMFKLATINPAIAVKIDNELGSLEKGKRADVLIIEIGEDDLPAITSCFVDGAHVFQVRYRC